jgi:hypothetical protein
LIFAAPNNNLSDLLPKPDAGAEEGKASHYALHPFQISAFFVFKGVKLQVQ